MSPGAVAYRPDRRGRRIPRAPTAARAGRARPGGGVRENERLRAALSATERTEKK